MFILFVLFVLAFEICVKGLQCLGNITNLLIYAQNGFNHG